ncbi:MAG: D-alanyl-D-alanine carboxypeptidase/D-alanyl-D-alanine-endopeptidase [Prevotellaceae bacterium]|jgi:D-alanyl-D-alanine carboxypeptidase/D-alanyl-D-alanine-endopeptidase (penicillin-binding protein 4)|nr:D-alanyl-D-alanine carboxypeptidase/D-alanyl-D-alanine-endopeptidase [Prevotellaceae bacterium]
MKNTYLMLLLLTLLTPVSLQGQNKSKLSAGINKLIKQQLPEGSNVGIAIYDLTDDTSLYAYQADKLTRPASTMKLLTAITSLAQPHAQQPFCTEVYYTGAIERDTLKGDLYVIGGFDPEFDTRALDSLVNCVARHPFSVIQGMIYGDVSMTDSLYWGAGWSWDDNPYSYQPYLSPLMFNKGTVTITATPAHQPGSPAQITCVPASSYYSVINRTQTDTPDAGRFKVTRNWLKNGNTIVVSGNVKNKRTSTINLYSSADFFMHTFIERLQAKGITPASAYEFKTLPANAHAVQMVRYETPMQQVIHTMLKESDNLNAEAIIYQLGAQTTGKKQVSAGDGIKVIEALIKQLGKTPDFYNIMDGSGLSGYNYITPDLLVTFLRYAHSHPSIYTHLYPALPIGGIDGTLSFRLKDKTTYENVRAKTGSFTGINCLAGYLTAANGHKIAFAVMNQNVLSERAARAFQDAVCETIVQSLKK